MSRLSKVDIVNAETLEKVVLGQRVATFLAKVDDSEERAAVINVARMLAQDVSLQVREALAFELRRCKDLPYDLSAKIASDVESVSGPFLAHTLAFTDHALAGLIPQLDEHAHITLARRSDLGPSSVETIMKFGSERTVGYAVRNRKTCLTERACMIVLSRFQDNENILGLMVQRTELPIAVVEQLILMVGKSLQDILIQAYGVDKPVAEEMLMSANARTVWQQIERASPQQIHAYLIELRKSGRLTSNITFEMVTKGCLPFLESVVALEAGLTIAAVREILYGGDMSRYVSLMREAGVSQSHAQEFLKVIQLRGGNAGWPPSTQIH